MPLFGRRTAPEAPPAPPDPEAKPKPKPRRPHGAYHKAANPFGGDTDGEDDDRAPARRARPGAAQAAPEAKPEPKKPRAKPSDTVLEREAEIKEYFDDTGVVSMLQEAVRELLQREELPGNPYLDLIGAVKGSELRSAGLFPSDREQRRWRDRHLNRSTEARGGGAVCHLPGLETVWGLPHVMRMVAPDRLRVLLQLLQSVPGLLDDADEPELRAFPTLVGEAVLWGSLVEHLEGVHVAHQVAVHTASFQQGVDAYAARVVAALQALHAGGRGRALIEAVFVPARHGRVRQWPLERVLDGDEELLRAIKLATGARRDHLPKSGKLGVHARALLRVTDGEGGEERLMRATVSFTMHLNDPQRKKRGSFGPTLFESALGGVFLSQADAELYLAVHGEPTLGVVARDRQLRLAGEAAAAEDAGDHVAAFALAAQWLAVDCEETPRRRSALSDVRRMALSTAAVTHAAHARVALLLDVVWRCAEAPAFETYAWVDSLGVEFRHLRQPLDVLLNTHTTSSTGGLKQLLRHALAALTDPADLVHLALRRPGDLRELVGPLEELRVALLALTLDLSADVSVECSVEGLREDAPFGVTRALTLMRGAYLECYEGAEEGDDPPDDPLDVQLPDPPPVNASTLLQVVNVKKSAGKAARRSKFPRGVGREGTLLQYAIDCRLDDAVGEIMHDILGHTLLDNPFPLVNKHLQRRAVRQALWGESDAALVARFRLAQPPPRLEDPATHTYSVRATSFQGDEIHLYGARGPLVYADARSVHQHAELLRSLRVPPRRTNPYHYQLCVGVHGDALLQGRLVRPLGAPAEIAVQMEHVLEGPKLAAAKQLFARHAVAHALAMHDNTAHIVVALALGEGGGDWGGGARGSFTANQVRAAPAEAEAAVAAAVEARADIWLRVVCKSTAETYVNVVVRHVFRFMQSARHQSSFADDRHVCSYEAVYLTRDEAVAARSLAPADPFATPTPPEAEAYARELKARISAQVTAGDLLDAHKAYLQLAVLRHDDAPAALAPPLRMLQSLAERLHALEGHGAALRLLLQCLSSTEDMRLKVDSDVAQRMFNNFAIDVLDVVGRPRGERHLYRRHPHKLESLAGAARAVAQLLRATEREIRAGNEGEQIWRPLADACGLLRCMRIAHATHVHDNAPALKAQFELYAQTERRKTVWNAMRLRRLVSSKAAGGGGLAGVVSAAASSGAGQE